jgi:YD repeat-containing protein
MNDLERQNLRGSISTLHSETSEWDASAASWRPQRISAMTHFRSDGQISELELQYVDGSFFRSTNDYDDAGRLIESRSRTNNGADTKSLYRYDSASRLIRVITVVAKGAQRDTTLFTYDETGRTTVKIFLEIEVAKQAMSFSADSGSSYNSDEAIFYDKAGKLLRRTTFTRDDRGRLLTAEDHVDDNLFGPEAFPDASSEEKQAVLAAFTQALGADRVISSAHKWPPWARTSSQSNTTIAETPLKKLP